MFKKITTILTLSFSLLSAPASASLTLEAAEWSGINDAFGGYKESLFIDNLFYVVSKTGIYDKSATYLMPDGYRQVSLAEYRNLFLGLNITYAPNNYVYYNQAGWNAYSFQGVTRQIFLFSDTHLTGFSTHAGTREGSTNLWSSQYTDNVTVPYVYDFGGFVLMYDESLLASSSTAADVSSPLTPLTPLGLIMSAIGLFMLKRKSKTA